MAARSFEGLTKARVSRLSMVAVRPSTPDEPESSGYLTSWRRQYGSGRARGKGVQLERRLGGNERESISIAYFQQIIHDA